MTTTSNVFLFYSKAGIGVMPLVGNYPHASTARSRARCMARNGWHGWYLVTEGPLGPHMKVLEHFALVPDGEVRLVPPPPEPDWWQREGMNALFCDRHEGEAEPAA